MLPALFTMALDSPGLRPPCLGFADPPDLTHTPELIPNSLAREPSLHDDPAPDAARQWGCVCVGAGGRLPW